MKAHPFLSILLLMVSATPTAALAADPVEIQNPDTVADEGGATQIVIEPLFEYPVAPDDLPDLKSKTNYIIEHFWDPFDLNRKEAVDQNALNHAFRVYASAMPYADASVVIDRTKRMLKGIKDNPVLLYQFTKAAEEALYGPRADIWIDEIYTQYLDELLKSKRIDQSRKVRYADQLKRLRATMPGVRIPEIAYTSVDGKRAVFKPDTEFSLMEFGYPDCDDCRYSRFKIEMSSVASDLTHQGKLKICFIVPDEDPDSEYGPMLTQYPASWITGFSPEAYDLLDLRQTPSFYILGEKGKILAKNLTVDKALEMLETLSAQGKEAKQK